MNHQNDIDVIIFEQKLTDLEGVKELLQMPKKIDEDKEFKIIFKKEALNSDHSIKELMRLLPKVQYFDGFGNQLNFLQELDNVKFCNSDSMIQNYLWPGDEKRKEKFTTITTKEDIAGMANYYLNHPNDI